MSTEYRRGIPCTAHVEAATRLGLLWGDNYSLDRRWHFEIRDGVFHSDFESPDVALGELRSGPGFWMPPDWVDLRPIRPDGTPVDWEVLDQEAARVGQQVQPQGFRATLFGMGRAADFLARWTVYQELKPLYDLVDGAQGEAAMPRDVEAEWSVCSGSNGASGNWRLSRDGEGLYAQGAYLRWRPSEDYYGVPLRNFAAVLDAVAERRVAERMRGQAQAPIVTSAQPEPRRFADVRPDRHGWRWWLVRHALPLHQTWLRIDHNRPYDWSTVETVIPTDEQGNPVSWESIGVRLNSPSASPAQAFFSAEPPTPPHLGQFSNNPATPPLTPEGLLSAMQNLHIAVGTGTALAKAPPTTPPPLPRFTADELDDVDHSRTTKLDEVTLRRGKLPTVEQIAKYREVRARRTGGAVADALKESRIDCEVAQYVLERWAGGLGDEEAHDLIHSTATLRVVVKGVVHIKAVDSRVVSVLSDCYSLDTSEKPSPAVQRERQEAEERRQRLAELRQRLAAERAAPQEMANESEASRFDLIEPDPQADPAASIRAWEARQAAAKVRPIPAPPRIAKPAAAPRRPAIEVVDTEVDGLSRVDVVTVLVGRAFNGGC